jgi:hypothetical protein
MRFELFAFLGTLVLSGCYVGAGAGASARLGARPEALGAQCDNFESCDVAYRDSLERAERCHRDGDEDCEAEDQDAAASYEALHDQTARELESLRGEAAEREAAFSEAEEAAEAARAEAGTDCAKHGHPVEPSSAPPTPRGGNSWFESEPSASAMPPQ